MKLSHRLHRTSALFIAFALFPAAASADEWPQWMGPNRDDVWRESGIVKRFPAEGPKIVFRAKIGGGYAGPAVVGDRIFVADFVTAANTKVENFWRSKFTGVERVLCLSATNGEIVWKHEYPCKYSISYPGGPRCTPTVDAGKVYALGAEGDLFCLDAQKGTVLWSKNFPKDYSAKTPMWGFCGHPLVDGNNLICVVGGANSTVVAFDKDTGSERWRSLSAREIGYSPPTIVEAGGVRQLLVWTGEALSSLDPATGKPYWSKPLAPRMGMSIMAPRKDGDYLFAGAVFGTALGLKLEREKPAAVEAWRGPANMKTLGVFPMNMTPFVENGVMYGVDQPGQLRAVRISSGERLWESWLPVTGHEKSRPVYCGTAFLIKNGDRFFVFNELGELIIAQISEAGYKEVSRAKLLEPTGDYQGRAVVWSHPAFAHRCVFVRNDKELVCASLAE